MKIFKKMAVLALSLAFTGAFAAEDGEILGEYGAITVKMLNGKKTAVLSATSKETINIPENVVIDSFYYDRSFSGTWGKPATIMFPFAIKNSCMSSTAGVFQFDSLVGKETWQIFASYVNNAEPNTPYFIRVNEGAEHIALGGYCFPITMNSTVGGNNVHKFENWEFTGTYSYKQWNEGDAQLGYVYGFAANEKVVNGKTIQQGQFVKGAAGVYIRPMRAYLIYNTQQNLAKSSVDKDSPLASLTTDDLPSSIDVIFTDEDGDITAIHSLDTRTGEFVDNTTGWYDMKGRKLDKKPTIKGTYFNNGKKVVIK